jgi:hypothetical protein
MTTLRQLLRRNGDVVEIVRVPHYQPTPDGYRDLRGAKPCHHDRFARLAARKIDTKEDAE